MVVFLIWWISFVPTGVFSWVRIPFLDPLQLIFSCNLENNNIICSHCLDSYLRQFLISWAVAAKLIWREIMFWQTKVSGGNSSLYTQIIKGSTYFTQFHQNVVKNYSCLVPKQNLVFLKLGLPTIKKVLNLGFCLTFSNILLF